MSKLNIILNLHRFYNGTIGRHSKIDTFHTSSVAVTNAKGAVSVEVDGEYLGEHRVRISVIPSALKFYC